MTIKLVKLSNTELIIGDVVFGDNDIIKIKDPLLLDFNRFGGSDFYMSRYIPMCDTEEIPISYKDILAIVTPNKKLINTWDESINHKPLIDPNIQFH